MIRIGEWILIVVHFLKQIGYIATGRGGINNETIINITNSELNDNLLTTADDTNNLFTFNFDHFKDIKLDHWGYFVCWSAVGSYTIYFAIGGFLHV